MYYITYWDDPKKQYPVAKLASAKRACRGLGHDRTHNGMYYAPVARVQDEGGYCVYNPVFKVGKDDDFVPTPIVMAPDGKRRKCSHGALQGCPHGCN